MKKNTVNGCVFVPRSKKTVNGRVFVPFCGVRAGWASLPRTREEKREMAREGEGELIREEKREMAREARGGTDQG
jgi:hypothetical protein